MKYINKKIANEPATLRDYRNTTPNATYPGFGDTDQLLKKALLTEQGYLCGYCMKRIESPANATVEHYISQELHADSIHSEGFHKQQSIIYNNMLAVCVNNGKHCDKSRGNSVFRKLNPHQRNCETLIMYSTDGKINSHNNVNVDYDIDLLKLNCQVLKDARTAFWEMAKENLIKKYPKGSWTKKILTDERQIYVNKHTGMFKPYCNYIVFMFDKLLMMPKYK